MGFRLEHVVGPVAETNWVSRQVVIDTTCGRGGRVAAEELARRR
jgi:hypothetical protein